MRVYLHCMLPPLAVAFTDITGKYSFHYHVLTQGVTVPLLLSETWSVLKIVPFCFICINILGCVLKEVGNIPDLFSLTGVGLSVFLSFFSLTCFLWSFPFQIFISPSRKACAHHFLLRKFLKCSRQVPSSRWGLSHLLIYLSFCLCVFLNSNFYLISLRELPFH